MVICWVIVSLIVVAGMFASGSFFLDDVGCTYVRRDD